MVLGKGKVVQGVDVFVLFEDYCGMGVLVIGLVLFVIVCVDFFDGLVFLELC